MQGDWSFGLLGGPPAAQAQSDASDSAAAHGSESGAPGAVVVNISPDANNEAGDNDQRNTADVVQLFQMLGRSSSRHSLEGMLWQAYLHDVVRSSLGLVAAEVWTDVDRGAGVQLQRAAYFIDPSFEELEVATTRLGRFSASKCAPGVGLAGVLWLRASRGKEPLSMVSLSTIAKDEDLPADQRTADLAQTFDLVAAARLEPEGRADVDGGLLILYARESARQVITHPANLDFLGETVKAGAQLVAAATARATLQAAKQNRSQAWAKVRRLLKSGFFLDAVRKEAERIESGETTVKEEPPKPSRMAPYKAWLSGYVRKFRGVPGAKAPPLKGLRSRPAWVTYAWTWVGVFLTLLTLSGVNTLVKIASDEKYFVMLGSLAR